MPLIKQQSSTRSHIRPKAGNKLYRCSIDGFGQTEAMERLMQALLASVTIICLAAGGIYIWARGSLPVMDGTIELAGITTPVRITRDRDAVPHIYAESTEGVMFGLGFAHAQDRLWQMEINRRIGTGRLSEVLGAATAGTDRFLRTFGGRRAAERAYDELDQKTRAALDSYTSGVNAFLETHDTPLPPEFLILRHQPEPWEPQDSLVWGKMMAWDLALNWRNELLRLRLSKLAGLTPGQISELFPPYPGDAPVALPDLSSVWSDTPVDIAGSPIEVAPKVSNGSNNWVLAGKRTTSGKPLLANDPHLGLGVPSVWYLAHLESPEFRAIGATLPGIPGIILGWNDRVAWGFTNLNADVQDLYVEKLVTGDPTSYLTPDGPRPLAVHSEVIHVRDDVNVDVIVRETIHGPVISDASSRAASAAVPTNIVSLAWTALRDGDSTARAILLMNQSRNWDEFVDALRLFKEPHQNVLYADIDGNIGYHAIGRVPIRHSANTGQGALPVPGWERIYEWTGYIPFEEMPHAFNPTDGSIATANHKIVDGSYPYFISKDWASSYRIRRIEAIQSSEELEEFSEHLKVDVTEEGLRIQIVDQEGSSMFSSGSAQPQQHMIKLIAEIATIIGPLPNTIAISGHTDSSPFRSASGKTNWELSTDRANASRRALSSAGIDPDKFVQVVGKADTDPLSLEDPFQPQNRRISIVLKREVSVLPPELRKER